MRTTQEEVSDTFHYMEISYLWHQTFSTKNTKLGWGDDAVSKELALQTRGPKFVSSSIHMKVSCFSALIISVLVGNKRQKDPWSLLASSIQWALGSVRDSASNTKWQVIEGGIWHLFLVYVSIYTHTHKYWIIRIQEYFKTTILLGIKRYATYW